MTGMYTISFLQVFHPVFHFVNPIQKVRRTVFGCVQVQRGRHDNTILHRQKRLFSFQNAHFFS